ncbi:hypothetical protein [Streptococcus sp. HF-100]|uniref:hypothetical protein n=1 Tax=Streptococcus sp. HF-100 TaxID=2785791 RepID=UPI00189D1847|nr:hypothetical protein [Streptococcus sp. HF-100]MBF7075935.1 hypothetical protein [Streptococcus sp. HF-100]
MSLKNLKELTFFQTVVIILLIAAGVQVVDKQNQQIKELQEQVQNNLDSIRVQSSTNQRQDVMINKFNQMYYEYQHKKITGRDDFPGG